MTPSQSPDSRRQSPSEELQELRARLAKLAHLEADSKDTLRLLQQIEQRQAYLLNSVPVALYSARPNDFARTWISGDIERVTGFFPDRFIDEPTFWQMRLHPEDADRVVKALAGLPEAGRVAVEYRWRCTDGSYRWFLDQAVLIRDARNEPKEVIGSWLDITERKRAVEELEQSEARLRDAEARFTAFMDNTTAVAFMKDDAGRMVYMNAPCLERFAFGSDWPGKTSRQLFPVDVAEKLEAHDREVREAGAARQFIESVPSTAGPREWLTIRFPFQDSAGRQFIGGIALDVTGVKHGEHQAALLSKIRELESMNRLMLEREDRIIELKAKVKALEAQLGGKGS